MQKPRLKFKQKNGNADEEYENFQEILHQKAYWVKKR